MPNPIRPPATPRTPRTPGTRPTTDASPARPRTPAAPADGFDRSRRPTTPPAPAIPQTNLGTVGDKNLVIGTDGKIGLDRPPASEGDELSAVTHLGMNTTAANAFAAVTDRAVLAKVSERLVDAHAGFARDTTSEVQRLELRQGRAAALKLLEDAALRAGELGDVDLRNQLTAQLARAIGKEPFRAVRDFAFNSLDTHGQADRLPKLKAAAEAIYPSKPPYEKWLKDGVINIHFIVDNDGSTVEDAVGYFESLGLKKRANQDGSFTFTRPKRGDKPGLEVTIPKPKDKHAGEKPELFSKMGDPKVDVIAYWGHAGYGHRVDHALAHGVSGTGDGKLVILAQCWGEGNVESIERAYPDAQVVSTTQMTHDGLDYPMLERLIKGFERKEGWESMHQGVNKDLKEVWEGDTENTPEFIDRHYFVPTTRTVLQKHYDRDGDGVKDAQDRIFNVVYPKRLDAAGGFDPVAQATPDYALDGQALSKAVNSLSLTLRYAKMLPADVQARLPWSPDAVVPGGFYKAEEGDNRAFRFVEDRATGKVQVQLSTRFSHTADKDLGRMLGFEAGLWYGQKAGLDDAGKVGLGLAMLERAVHQQGDWYSSQTLLDEPWAEESMFLSRYGLDKASFAGVLGASGNPDDFLPEHFQAIANYVRQNPELGRAATANPKRVGTPLNVPEGIRLPAQGIDKAALENALSRLGIRGSVESFSPQWLSEGQPNNLAVAARTADGKTVLVGLGVDSEGILRSASTLALNLDRMKEQGARQYLGELAQRASVPAAELTAVFDRSRQAGRSVAESIGEVLVALRPRVAPGTEIPRMSTLTALEQYGLADPVEWAAATTRFARLFPQGAAVSAEQAFFRWAESVPGADAGALRARYLAQMTGDPDRTGPADGLRAVLDALPRPLPAGSQPLDLNALFKSGLIAPAALPELSRALFERTGTSPLAFTRAAVLDVINQWGRGMQARPAAEAAADEAIRANASAKDLILRMAAAAHREGGADFVPTVDTALLEAAGLLSAADAQAVNVRLAELRRG